MNIDISNKTRDILTEYGLDFRIEKQHTGFINGGFSANEDGIITLEEGASLNSSPYFNLVNGSTGMVLNSVAKGYQVSQNDEIVEKVVRGMEPFGDKLRVHKAGALNGGRKVFIQLEIDGMAKVGGDSLKRYVTIIDSNDGSTGLSVGIGNFTMSCSNQFFFFHKENGMKFRHTAALVGHISNLSTRIQEALEMDLRQMELFKTFASTPCSRNLSHVMVKELVGLNKQSSEKELGDASTRKYNAMEKLYENIENEMNSKGNNLWGLQSGVTRWTTHDKSHPQRTNGQIESYMTGTNQRTAAQGLDVTNRLLQNDLVLA